MTFNSILIALLGGSAIVWYFLCLIYLGFIQPKAPAKADGGFRPFMSLSVSTISGTLATYVGMVLGIQSAANKTGANPVAAILQSGLTPLSYLQGIAAIAYVFSLLMALTAWWWNRANPDETIVALGRSFLGLIGGSLAVLLNVSVT